MGEREKERGEREKERERARDMGERERGERFYPCPTMNDKRKTANMIFLVPFSLPLSDLVVENYGKSCLLL